MVLYPGVHANTIGCGQGAVRCALYLLLGGECLTAGTLAPFVKRVGNRAAEGLQGGGLGKDKLIYLTPDQRTVQFRGGFMRWKHY